MKNILNKIKFILILIIAFITLFSYVESIELDTVNSDLKLYEVKEKEEVLVEDNKILKFYEDTHEEVEILIEEKRQEEIRIAEEKKLEEERKKLEEQRKKQYITYSADMITSDSEIVNFAIGFIGNPYVAGGSSLTTGTDCSGFVMLVYANFGISLPRTAPAQSSVGTPVSIDNIQPGDIVSYGYNGFVGHSALYVGNGMIIHAATPELGIRLDPLYMMPIITVRRVI